MRSSNLYRPRGILTAYFEAFNRPAVNECFGEYPKEDGYDMAIILTFTYPALCFLDLSEMPSLDMSLLKTTIPINMLTCGKQTVVVLDKASRRQKKMQHAVQFTKVI